MTLTELAARLVANLRHRAREARDAGLDLHAANLDATADDLEEQIAEQDAAEAVPA